MDLCTKLLLLYLSSQSDLPSKQCLTLQRSLNTSRPVPTSAGVMG